MHTWAKFAFGRSQRAHARLPSLPMQMYMCIEQVHRMFTRVLVYARGNRRRRANQSDESENQPINPHDVGSVLSHDKLMGEVFCTRSDHPRTITLNFPP